MAQQQWYNKADLIEEARRRHFRANEELIDDWIAKGLLGEAGYRKRPGRGSIARWSEAQLQLFLTLLEHRQREQGKVRIGILCNVPVWKWLYWGELGGVVLPQVRQAMRSWVTFRKDIPAKKIRKDATILAQQVEHLRAEGKRALISRLTEMNDLTETTTMKKKDVDRDEEQEELKYLLESVVVPNTPGTARQLGKEKVEYLSTMLLIRPEALNDYNAIDELPDELWEWARTVLLVTIIQRLAGHSVLIDELAGSYHTKRITVNMLCDSACHYLLTLLGIAQQGQFTRESIGYVPYLDPQTWKRQEVSVSITTQIVHSPLLLPGGQRVPYLRNDLLIIYRGEQQRFSLDLPFI